MSEPMTLAQEFAALNEATKRAHEAIADLRAERKLLAADIKASEAARLAIRQEINDQCNALIKDCVETQLAQFEPDIKKAIEKAKANVERSFTRLESLYLGGTGPNVEPIEDMVLEKVAAIIVARRQQHLRRL